MPFDTFHIPEVNPKAEEVMQRLADQGQRLQNIVAKLYLATDNQLAAQDKALNRINGKLSRAVNGRLKQQDGIYSNIAAKLTDTVNGNIALQGQQLALQSALLSRLAPSGAGGDAPVTPTVPSLTPGAFAPVLPQPIGQTGPMPTFPSPQSGGGVRYAVLVNCDDKTLDVYDLTEPNTIALVQNGSFVPIRYDVGRADLYSNWLGRGQGNLFTENIQYQSQWVDIACHARATNGQGWPQGGDFPHYLNTSLAYGFPVGDWPFDQNGNYIGL